MNAKKIILIVLAVVVLFAMLIGSAIIGGAVTYLVMKTSSQNSQADFPITGIVPEQRSFKGRVFVDPSLMNGALVTNVVPDSPADQAGLQVGDRILSVDDVEISVDASLADIISTYSPGDEVTLLVERPSEDSIELVVTLGKNPDKPEQAYMGITYLPSVGGLYTDEIRPFEIDPDQWHESSPDQPLRVFPFTIPEQLPFDLPEDLDLISALRYAVIIRDIVEESPASQVELQKGDLILKLDGKEFDGSTGLKEEISKREPGIQVELTIYRIGDEETQVVTVELAEDPNKEGQGYLGVSVDSLRNLRRFRGEDGPLNNLPFDLFRQIIPNTGNDT